MQGDFFLTQWFFLGMRWLCENVVNNNVFLTILISTVTLRLLTLPSDIMQRKSMAKTAAMQPELQKLQEKYKNDPQRFQQEQQKLMKKSGAGMLTGCLPLIITMVLLFCFIAAFRFWSYEQNVKTLDEMSTNIQHALQDKGLASEDADVVECFDIYCAELDKIYNNDELTDAQKEKEATAFLSELHIDISETFTQSEFIWIHNIWQPDNGFSPVVIPADTFYGANYKSTKKLIYLAENDGTEHDVRQRLRDLGIFYDEKTNYNDINESGAVISDTTAVASKSDVTYDQLTKTQTEGLLKTAKQRYDYLTAPLSRVYPGQNNGWFVLPVLATLFQLLYVFYSQRMQKKTAPVQAGTPNTAKYMLYIMPVMSFIFCLQYTAAFALYWTLSSITMLIVNIILSKFISTDTKKEA